MTSSDPRRSDVAWITLITGMSGSGKSTAVQALEDEGFFCIDNLPPKLAAEAVNACLSARDRRQRIALVLDARSGHLLEDVPAAVLALRDAGHTVDVLFLDASDEILIRRFSETRRRHPLDGSSLTESILAERRALVPLRALATRVVDTSGMNRHDLRRLVGEGVRTASEALSVTVMSFGFKFGLPVEADLVFDVRHLRNPHFVSELKPLSGLDAGVSAYVLEDPHAREFLNRIHDLLRYLLPLYQREGKRYLTVAVGCTGGKHRSVTLAEELKRLLNVAARHRDIERS
jgi:UPF0042 nucleotide-binding protein